MLFLLALLPNLGDYTKLLPGKAYVYDTVCCALM